MSNVQELELTHNVVDVFHDHVGLVLCYSIDPMIDPSVHKQCFPSRNRIRPDHWVIRGKLIALVQRIPALDVVPDFYTELLRLGVEELSVVFACEGLEVGEEGRRHLFEDVLAVDPMGVTTRRREDVDFQYRVIRWDVFERYVEVPSKGGPSGYILVSS